MILASHVTIHIVSTCTSHMTFVLTISVYVMRGGWKNGGSG